MFEPFVSSKRTVGVGMGLTVARHSLRSLGGEVTMVSRPDGGSSAILVHPVRDPRHRDKSGGDDDRRPAFRSNMDEDRISRGGHHGGRHGRGPAREGRLSRRGRSPAWADPAPAAPASPSGPASAWPHSLDDLLAGAGTLVVAFKPQHLAGADPRLAAR